MNVFLVAIGVLACALSAQSACTYQYSGNGGVFDSNKNYIPGNAKLHTFDPIVFDTIFSTYLLESVLVWVDIANNARQWADADGQNILDNWNLASTNFDYSFQANPSANPVLAGVIANTLRQAQLSFGLLKSHIVGNDAFAQFLADTDVSFKAQLDSGDNDSINAYMINAYPNFQNVICN